MFLIELYYFDKYMKRPTSGCTVPKMGLFLREIYRGGLIHSPIRT